MSSLSSSPSNLFLTAIVLRVALLFYGLWQDANSPINYTDIDYHVFTDASRFVAQGQSPYDRETYRYTPLLAWVLVPTSWSNLWFSYGKGLFAAGDVIAGWLIVYVLRFSLNIPTERALGFASIWLLNPMVATISTRGSSEGLLGAMVIAMLWAVVERRILLAGFLLGLGVHFKIYPFIYAPSIVWWLDEDCPKFQPNKPASAIQKLIRFCSIDRIQMVITSLITYVGLNSIMYSAYGWPFIQHTYLHHVTRIDHRHNFSPYNILLYLRSSTNSASNTNVESVAFIPQLLLSAVAIPFVLAKKDLASTMLAQTFAFVSFNKVCTSQYFLWYMVFLPFHLPSSSLLARRPLGLTAMGLWILIQGLWLQQGFQLEFLGQSSFVPGLWMASLLLFATNIWILGILVSDIGLGFD